MGQAQKSSRQVLGFYTFAGPWVISVSRPLMTLKCPLAVGWPTQQPPEGAQGSLLTTWEMRLTRVSSMLKQHTVWYSSTFPFRILSEEQTYSSRPLKEFKSHQVSQIGILRADGFGYFLQENIKKKQHQGQTKVFNDFQEVFQFQKKKNLEPT